MDVQVVSSLGDFGLGLERLDALPERLDLVAARLAGLERAEKRRELVVQLAKLGLGDLDASLCTGVLGFAERLELDLELNLLPL